MSAPKPTAPLMLGMAVSLGEESRLPGNERSSGRQAPCSWRHAGIDYAHQSASESNRRLDNSGTRKYESTHDADMLLSQSPGLRTILDEAADKIRAVFGADTRLCLKVFENPESPEPDRSLFLFIMTSLEPESAIGLLNHFDELWWIDNASRANGALEISIEYV